MKTEKQEKYCAEREIRKAFLRGEILTVQKTFSLYHSTELRSTVKRLSKEGMRIISRKKPGERYHVYFLDVEKEIK